LSVCGLSTPRKVPHGEVLLPAACIKAAILCGRSAMGPEDSYYMICRQILTRGVPLPLKETSQGQ
jgi:hypothetical protein